MKKNDKKWFWIIGIIFIVGVGLYFLRGELMIGSSHLQSNAFECLRKDNQFNFLNGYIWRGSGDCNFNAYANDYSGFKGVWAVKSGSYWGGNGIDQAHDWCTYHLGGASVWYCVQDNPYSSYEGFPDTAPKCYESKPMEFCSPELYGMKSFTLFNGESFLYPSDWSNPQDKYLTRVSSHGETVIEKNLNFIPVITSNQSCGNIPEIPCSGAVFNDVTCVWDESACEVPPPIQSGKWYIYLIIIVVGAIACVITIKNVKGSGRKKK
jgi:hypothetical protein